jgi:uncharacterized membrane protein YoaK (UPF0700 family)
MTDGSKRQSEMTLVLMLALTFSTGIVDAVGYLGLDKVFAGNMTGNVVILGMAIVGADGLPWVGPLVALIAFMVGAVIGGRTLRRETIGWNTRTSWSFTAVAAALAVLTGVTIATGGVPPKPWELGITVLLAAAMGFQAAVARQLRPAVAPAGGCGRAHRAGCTGRGAAAEVRDRPTARTRHGGDRGCRRRRPLRRP